MIPTALFHMLLTKLSKIRSYLSPTRVQLLGRYVAAKVTECKITVTVVTSVSTLCNAIFKIDKASRAWNLYPIEWFSNWVELRCDNKNCFTIKFQVLNTWVYSSGSSIYMCREKLDKEINKSFNSLCKKFWSLPKPSKIEKKTSLGQVNFCKLFLPCNKRINYPKTPILGLKNPRKVYLRDSFLPCKKWKNKAPVVCCQAH